MQGVHTRLVVDPATTRTVAGAPARIIIALVLALLTGLTLGQWHVLGGALFANTPGVSAEATRAGADFYVAIDAYLATGESGRLRTLTTPDFVDHTANVPAVPGIEAVLHQLDSLHALDSEARFIVKPISSGGDMVRFAVSIAPVGQAQVLGLPLAQSETTPASETLRIVDGRIAERWSYLQLPVASTSLASLAWDPSAATQMLPAIERVTMLRGGKMTFQLGTAHVIVVERGTLKIEGTMRSTNPGVPKIATDAAHLAGVDPVIALPGSTVVAAGYSSYRITNDSPGVASALIIRIAGYALPTDGPVFGAFGTSRNDVGVQLETLAAATKLPNHTGEWTIEIGRATLAAGTVVPAHVVAGGELIFVEQGALETDLGACARRCVQTIEGAGSFAIDRDSLRAGQGISASDGATTSYRVAGSAPATMLIVTVAPARS